MNPHHHPHKIGGVFDESDVNDNQNNQSCKPLIVDGTNKRESNKHNKASEEEKSSEISAENAYPEHLNLGIIGHVDHGKSTIAGQILLQSGQIDERTINKYKKLAKDKGRDSWWLAFLLDLDPEERARGKTIECGKAYFSTSNKRFTIIDAPGHLNYISNMIIGASQCDICLLVISARKGEFECGFDGGSQIREHSLIAHTMGISRIIVVINKMDTIQWNKERYLFIKNNIFKFLHKDIGFKKKYISFVPISGQKGINIKNRMDNKNNDWYDGASLFEILDSIKPIKRKYDKGLRLSIQAKYKTDGGLKAIGLIQQGRIKKGEMIKIIPSSHLTKISALSIDDDKQEEINIAKAGQNVIIQFDKTDKLLLNRKDILQSGSVLCDIKNKPIPIVSQFIAQVHVHEIPDGLILTKGYQAMFHCHNLCVLSEIEAIKKARFLRKGDRATIKIGLKQKCALEAYDECRGLGRFILRDQNKTVMIGKIEKVIQNGSGLTNRKNQSKNKNDDDNEEQKDGAN